MSLAGIPVVGVVGFAVLGLVTTVGAFVVSLLVAGVVRAGLQLAGWLMRRTRVRVAPQSARPH
jgi:hypothetical protein